MAKTLNAILAKLGDLSESSRIKGLDTIALEIDSACDLIRDVAVLKPDHCVICKRPHGPACRCEWASL